LLLIRGWFQNQPCMLCIYQSSTMHLGQSISTYECGTHPVFLLGLSLETRTLTDDCNISRTIEILDMRL
jgi:hypothetical protein